MIARPVTLVLLFALPSPGAAATSASASAAHYGDLPPPDNPGAAAIDAPQQLELELIVNGLATGRIARVEAGRGRYRLNAADLRDAGIRIAATSDIVDLAMLEGVRADYDRPRQRLYLTVTPELLPRQRVAARQRKITPASYDTGALLNYDSYVSGGGGKTQASLFHEARVFSRAGMVSTSGALRTGPGKSYIRHDTVFRRSTRRRRRRSKSATSSRARCRGRPRYGWAAFSSAAIFRYAPML